ncbi:DUF2871 domain-containing protein [Paeniglutamicibacter psychrophenolicus]|uniref:DUF2871 domain-containing protein n=1 Tax=Paeniglutamicibacter psychrophenolicus TaxID=257454 RepID=A0ABS4W8B6_9MICC|nr:DUF2871 domain-containing protein [Paeniglutamicibacter psychrophenolicus]MBP2372447.1 hypothetical protein [Paeniglutamicibacter psychrophenolicus]
MMRLLYTAFAFGITGVLSGLYYRELTKANDFMDRSASQLPLVHTHLLVLGFVFLLIVLALEKIFGISAAAPRAFTWFYWLWTVGVAVTGGMMLVKGTLVVLGTDASSAAFAGIAGLGHISLTVAVVVLFVSLRTALMKADTLGPVAPALGGR